jgi:hypothetical protein
MQPVRGARCDTRCGVPTAACQNIEASGPASSARGHALFEKCASALCLKGTELAPRNWSSDAVVCARQTANERCTKKQRCLHCSQRDLELDGSFVISAARAAVCELHKGTAWSSLCGMGLPGGSGRLWAATALTHPQGLSQPFSSHIRAKCYALVFPGTTSILTERCGISAGSFTADATIVYASSCHTAAASNR